jgi:hypothetical protein
MSVKKPTFRAAAVAVVFTAAGEIGFNASYNVSMTRTRPNDGAPQQLQAPNSTERGWSAIDQQRMSMDGHHVIWAGTLPSLDGAVDLNLDAGRFSFSRTFPLSIELNCTAGEPCVEDGDTVHTLVTAVSASDGLVSEVLISTTVQSLVSCEHSRGWIDRLRPDEDSVSRQNVAFFLCDRTSTPTASRTSCVRVHTTHMHTRRAHSRHRVSADA